MVIVLGQITEGDGCYGTVTPGLVETAEQSTAPLKNTGNFISVVYDSRL